LPVDGREVATSRPPVNTIDTAWGTPCDALRAGRPPPRASKDMTTFGDDSGSGEADAPETVVRCNEIGAPKAVGVSDKGGGTADGIDGTAGTAVATGGKLSGRVGGIAMPAGTEVVTASRLAAAASTNPSFGFFAAFPYETR